MHLQLLLKVNSDFPLAHAEERCGDVGPSQLAKRTQLPCLAHLLFRHGDYISIILQLVAIASPFFELFRPAGEKRCAQLFTDVSWSGRTPLAAVLADSALRPALPVAATTRIHLSRQSQASHGRGSTHLRRSESSAPSQPTQALSSTRPNACTVLRLSLAYRWNSNIASSCTRLQTRTPTRINPQSLGEDYRRPQDDAPEGGSLQDRQTTVEGINY